MDKRPSRQNRQGSLTRAIHPSAFACKGIRVENAERIQKPTTFSRRAAESTEVFSGEQKFFAQDTGEHKQLKEQMHLLFQLLVPAPSNPYASEAREARFLERIILSLCVL